MLHSVNRINIEELEVNCVTVFIKVMSVPEKVLLRKLKKREHKKFKFLREKGETGQTCEYT
jgi:hypothetical protein